MAKILHSPHLTLEMPEHTVCSLPYGLEFKDLFVIKAYSDF